MSNRIDAELERIKKLGQTPKAIHVGGELYSDLDREINPTPAADLVGDGQIAYVITPNKVTEYKGIPVLSSEIAAPEYLHIQTQFRADSFDCL